MKTLLLFPPDEDSMIFKDVIIPMGITSIASLILDRGGDVKIYSGASYKAFRIEKLVADYQPGIVGISCDSGNRINCYKIAKLIKSISKDIVIVLGGIHATIFHQQILKLVPEVDFIVRGEGELTFIELISALKHGKQFSKIKGVSFIHDKTIIMTPDRGLMQNLDALPFIKYELLEMDKITSYLFDPWIVQTSRGCPHSCRFCASVGLWGHSIRFKSERRVAQELLEIKNKYKQDRFSFTDQTLTCHGKRLEAICQFMIDNGLQMKWMCFSDVRSIRTSLIKLMKKAGCEYVLFGVESFSDRMLELMRKGYYAKDAINALNMCQAVGMTASFKLLFGFPGETIQTLADNLRAFRKLHKGVVCSGINIFEPHPGAPIYPLLEQHGWVNDQLWFTDFKMSDFVKLKYEKKLVWAISRASAEIEKMANYQRTRYSNLKSQSPVNNE